MEDKTTVTISLEDWAKITAVMTLLSMKIDGVKDSIEKLREEVQRNRS